MVWILLPTFAAGDSEVKNLLSSLRNKVLLLRQPAAGDHLHFDTNGFLVGGEMGKVNLFGWLEITKAKLKKNKLQLEANRLVAIYDPGKKKLVQYRSGYVQIEAIVPNPSATAIQELLAKIFTPPDMNDTPVIPDIDEKGENTGKDGELRTLNNGEQVYRLGGEVKAPRVIAARDPEYSDYARQTCGGHQTGRLWLGSTSS